MSSISIEHDPSTCRALERDADILRTQAGRPVPDAADCLCVASHTCLEDALGIVPVNTPELLREVYRLRYQVFCLESRIFDACNYPDGLEVDAFDVHSVHSLLIHRPTGMAAGAVRLVLPIAGGARASFPLQYYSADRMLPSSDVLMAKSTAEISRFCISKSFRDRMAAQHESTYQGEAGVQQSRHLDARLLPSITLGLMRAIVEMSVAHDLSNWCALLEPTLLRLLARFGIRFREVGAPIDCYGVRHPVLSDIDGLLRGIWIRRPDAWAVITDSGRLWPLSRHIGPS